MWDGLAPIKMAPLIANMMDRYTTIPNLLEFILDLNKLLPTNTKHWIDIFMIDGLFQSDKKDKFVYHAKSLSMDNFAAAIDEERLLPCMSKKTLISEIKRFLELPAIRKNIDENPNIKITDGKAALLMLPIDFKKIMYHPGEFVKIGKYS